MTPEEAFHELRTKLENNISKKMRETSFGLQEKSEILEMTSERSESSSYLETDSAEKSKGSNSEEERRKASNPP